MKPSGQVKNKPASNLTSSTSKKQKSLTDFFRKMPAAIAQQPTSVPSQLEPQSNKKELPSQIEDDVILISSSPIKPSTVLKPINPTQIKYQPASIAKTNSTNTKVSNTAKTASIPKANPSTTKVAIAPRKPKQAAATKPDIILSPFPHTPFINQDSFIDLFKLHEFFISFSKPLFDQEFTYTLDEFSQIIFNQTKSTLLMQLFYNIFEYLDLFHIICDFKKYKNLEFDTKVFLQRELECIFHSTTFTDHNEEAMKVISNVYGENEWIDIDGSDHLTALTNLVFNHLTDSREFIKFLDDSSMQVRNESKAKWARNAKRKEFNTEIARLDKEIFGLDADITVIKAKYEKENEIMMLKDESCLDDGKALQKECSRETNTIHSKRDLLVGEYNHQTSLLAKLEKEEESAAIIGHELEFILKQSGKMLIGVDRNGTLYWWIQINPELCTILLEHTDGTDPSITVPKSHAELLSITSQMQNTDTMNYLLKRNLIDRFHKQDSKLSFIVKTGPLVIDDSATINNTRLKGAYGWFEQCGMKSTEINTGSYTDLFKYALPPLMFHCNYILQEITLKMQIKSIEAYDIALLGAFDLKPIVKNLVAFFNAFEEESGLELQNLFTEFDQLRSVILFSDLCEWIHSLTDALRTHEKTLKHVKKDGKNVKNGKEEEVFVDPGVRIRKQVTTLVYDNSPVAKKRGVSSRYKAKVKVIVSDDEEMESSEDGEADFSMESLKENKRVTRKRTRKAVIDDDNAEDNEQMFRGRSPRKKRGSGPAILHYESESD